MSVPGVVAITASYGRPGELARLLTSLQASNRALEGVIVVANGPEDQTRAVVAAAGPPVRILQPGTNLGCGGGLRLAEQTALQWFPALTHLWILDDDAVIMPQTLDALLDAMQSGQADAAHPLTEGPTGELGWFPGLLDREKFRIIRQAQTPDQFVARCGSEPVGFSWTQGIALLVTRRVLDQLGFHRDDYWVRGEDLEFSLRITARYRGIYVPAARVRHLPPESAATQLPKANSTTAPSAGEYLRHLAMLQNIAYTGLRLPHGRRIARTLPGNWLRFCRSWGFGPRSLADSLLALARGALLGLPAGRRLVR